MPEKNFDEVLKKKIAESGQSEEAVTENAEQAAEREIYQGLFTNNRFEQHEWGVRRREYVHITEAAERGDYKESIDKMREWFQIKDE